MRTRRAFRPVVDQMPTRDVPSNLLYPTNPTAPVQIPTTPPVSYIDPTDPYYIPSPLPYEEPIVGPDNPPSPLSPSIDLLA